jgi:hypothetical protein
MIYPTNVQSISFKYFVFWLHKKDKCVDLDMCIFKSQILSDFFIFCSQQHKELHIKNLHALNLHCWLCPEFIFAFFETHKYDFIFF